MSADGSPFPLDAEQIVRGLGFALAQLVNVHRHRSEGISPEAMTMALGRAMGVPLPIERDETGDERYVRGPARLLPYAQTPSASPEAKSGGPDHDAPSPRAA